MGSNPSNPNNPPDKWTKMLFPSRPDSEEILSTLNNQPTQVTAAFGLQCTDGWFLFLGFYGS